MDILVEKIKKGGIAVIRTDTIYGIVASVFDIAAVKKIYHIKKRNPLKSMIVLAANYNDIRSLGIEIDEKMQDILTTYWPGKISIIIPNSGGSKIEHIHHGTEDIAFRIPNDKKLVSLLERTGPIIAPSANIEGSPPALSIDEAKKYFKNSVDYYSDGGVVTGTKPSKLIKLNMDLSIQVLRD